MNIFVFYMIITSVRQSILYPGNREEVVFMIV